MNNNATSKLILAFVVLIVGLALIGSVANNTNSVTDKTGVSAETLDISSARLGTGSCPMSIDPTVALSLTNSPTGWKTADCPITNFVMLNQTGETATVTTDYVLFASNGTLLLKNTTAWVLPNCSATGTGTETSNTTILSYIYCQDEYVNIAWGRTILDLVAGFFALALLGISVGLFYGVAKDAGIVGR